MIRVSFCIAAAATYSSEERTPSEFREIEN
jgi:hypothetical protein